MSKPLDLNKSVYELTQKYPELVNIMKELGFTEITNPAMLHSMGRMMTIPKGAKMKKIPMLDVVMALLQHGFELVGQMPDMATAQNEMRAVVDQNMCIGCGMCAGLASDSFRMNDEGKAEFFAESKDVAVQEAIDSCPVSAISEE